MVHSNPVPAWQVEEHMASDQLAAILSPAIDFARHRASVTQMAEIAYRCTRVLVGSELTSFTASAAPCQLEKICVCS